MHLSKIQPARMAGVEPAIPEVITLGALAIEATRARSKQNQRRIFSCQRGEAWEGIEPSDIEDAKFRWALNPPLSRR